MSEVPPVSVVMTVFNGGQFLPFAIESILGQTAGDFEFLIVDDASQDSSREVVEGYARKDRRIRLFASDVNRGQTACLNHALEQARGTWIARQDADDVSMPERLEAQAWSVEGRDDVVLVGTNGWVINEVGEVTGLIHAPLESEEVRSSLPFRNPFIHTSVMFRRVLADGWVVRYDERFRICQDWDLWRRLLRKGQGANLGERLVAYRHLSSSLSRGASEDTQRESEAIVEAAWKEWFPAVPFEPTLLKEFREGEVSSNRKRFWKLHGRCVEGEAAAVHHAQVAGALLPRDALAAMREILAAMLVAPRWTAGVILTSLAIRCGLVRGFGSR